MGSAIHTVVGFNHGMGLCAGNTRMDGTVGCELYTPTVVDVGVLAADIEGLFGPSGQREMPPERTTKKARSARSVREDLLLAALTQLGMEEIERRIRMALEEETDEAQS